MSLIYPDPAHPYYIVTPSFDAASAGVRCLHLLCHALNRSGQVAYILQDPAGAKAGKPFVTGVDLLAPKLDPRIAQEHLDRGKVPIVVYPETISGNPYAASCVVRYVCNFPGLLAGDVKYCPREFVYAFSQSLATAVGVPDNVLFIPVINTSIYKPADVPLPRRGTCFYADKFRKVHGGIPGAITKDSVEITRHQVGSQSPDEVAALFQTSELFFAYENTALAIEAVLCGCPAVFIPNPFLERIIGASELGSDGYAWGVDPSEIARAKATVAKGAANYHATIDTFHRQLAIFVDATQAHAAQSDAARPMTLPFLPVIPYSSLPEALCMEALKNVPSRLRLEVGKFLCTLGFQRPGAALQRSSCYRSYDASELRIKGKT